MWKSPGGICARLVEREAAHRDTAPMMTATHEPERPDNRERTFAAAQVQPITGPPAIPSGCAHRLVVAGNPACRS
jgi:hypothetical protein